jgi:predicted DNA-binding ribbon-helix-helix protein
MERRQVSLPVNVFKQLKKLAKIRGVSLAMLIKNFINETEEVLYQEIEGCYE